MSRTHGVTDEELRALAGGSFEKRFTPSEEVALAYAEGITLSNAVRDAVFETLRRHFSEEEIIELTATITWEICAAKLIERWKSSGAVSRPARYGRGQWQKADS